ncbi:MAG: 2-hydroxyacyl-CoA dehydratase family protein [Desulfatibacillaceae bacterium]|nr:2-hydroxyacyl-CoA dehydratase family protein [Desulfatibacillaceae bacterium]
MRQELMEYDFIWSVNNLLSTAAKTAKGTPKEYQALLKRIPHFADLIDSMVGLGEPGIVFLESFAEYTDMILKAKAQGKKTCFTTFCQSPVILHAMDVVPLVLEVLTVAGTLIRKSAIGEFMDYCLEAGFTETSCSSQRGSMGAYLAGLAEKPDFVLIDTPGICDTNANSFAFAAAHFDIPFYQLNYPPTLDDERSIEYHRKDFKHMISFLEEQTGKKLDVGRLREIMLEMQRQDEMVCELQDLQRLIPNPVPGIYNLFIYAIRFTMAGLPACTRMIEVMLKKAKENAAAKRAGTSSGKEHKRALFVYIDHYAANLPLFNFLDQHNISHLGGILDRYYQEDAFYKGASSYKTETETLDAMIDSLARQNAHLPMVKQIRGPYDSPEMWLDEVKRLAEALNPDLAIYSGTPGCRNTWGMVKLFVNDLEKTGYPTHIINSDAFDDRVESWEATAHRLQEFLDLRGFN